MNEGLAKFLVGLKFLRRCKIYCGNDEASTQWLAFLLSSYFRWRCCSFIIRTTEVTKKVGYRMYHTLRQRQTQHVAWLHWTTLALQPPLCLPLGQGTNSKIVYAYASNPRHQWTGWARWDQSCWQGENVMPHFLVNRIMRVIIIFGWLELIDFGLREIREPFRPRYLASPRERDREQRQGNERWTIHSSPTIQWCHVVMKERTSSMTPVRRHNFR